MTPRLTAETFCFAPAQSAKICVTVEGKVFVANVGRRLHHRAGVHRREASCPGQGQSSPLWHLSGHERHGRWCRVRARTLERPTLGSVQSFSTICNAND